MSVTALGLAAMLAATAPSNSEMAREAADRAALAKMRLDIGQAFARGDIAAIMACHADAVEKSFEPGSRLVGKAAVEESLRTTLSQNRVTFRSNELESLLIRGDVAVEVARFVIEGTPKTGGQSWSFGGRTQVVYLRDAASPCGWSTIRELVQPAQ